MIALLRGINVGGNRKVPMPTLRLAAAKAGFTQVETYINSGNLIFEAEKMGAREAEDRLEKKILQQFGFPVDVLVRTAKQWKKYAASTPFADAAKARPNLLMLGLSKRPCARKAVDALNERAGKSERLTWVKGAIWVDFAEGAGKSKLTPAWFDKAAGSPVTLRNFRTVLKLLEMLDL